MKSKTCPRKICRFFHLKETDYVEPRHENSRRYERPTPNENQYRSFESRNRFEPLRETETRSNQVFHQDPADTAITLAAIMKKLADMEALQL